MSTEIAVNIFMRSRRSDMVNGSGQVRFGSGKLLTGKSGAYTIQSGLRHILLNIDDASYASVANEGVISISVSGEMDEEFAIPGFAAAVQLLDQCAVDLGRHWGFTKEQQKSLAKAPEPLQPLHKYFDPSDYPEAAMMRGSSGRAKVRITVSETGQPTDCVLIKPSGDTALDAATCSVFMQSARFHPALDNSGKPMKALIVENVSWYLG
jgi:TonB family protein